MRFVRNYLSSDFIPVEFANSDAKYFIASFLRRYGLKDVPLNDDDEPCGNYCKNLRRFRCAAEDVLPIEQTATAIVRPGISSIGAPIIATKNLHDFMRARLENAPEGYSIALTNSGFSIDGNSCELYDEELRYAADGTFSVEQPFVNLLAQHNLARDLRFIAPSKTLVDEIVYANTNAAFEYEVNSDNFIKCLYGANNVVYGENVLPVFHLEDCDYIMENSKKDIERYKHDKEIGAFDTSHLTFFDTTEESDDLTYHYHCCIHSLPIKFSKGRELLYLRDLATFDSDYFYNFNAEMTPAGLVVYFQATVEDILPDRIRTYVDEHSEDLFNTELAMNLMGLLSNIVPHNTVILREHGTWYAEKNGVVVKHGTINKALVRELDNRIYCVDVNKQTVEELQW